MPSSSRSARMALRSKQKLARRPRGGRARQLTPAPCSGTCLSEDWSEVRSQKRELWDRGTRRAPPPRCAEGNRMPSPVEGRESGLFYKCSESSTHLLCSPEGVQQVRDGVDSSDGRGRRRRLETASLEAHTRSSKKSQPPSSGATTDDEPGRVDSVFGGSSERRAANEVHCRLDVGEDIGESCLRCQSVVGRDEGDAVLLGSGLQVGPAGLPGALQQSCTSG